MADPILYGPGYSTYTRSARLALDVVESNKRARQLYESRGLAAEARWPKHLWLGRFRILRMAKPLGDGAATSGES